MTSTGVPLRRPGAWQIEPDERLLELLRGEGWTSPETLAAKPNVHLTTWMVERRLRMLADAGLVAPLDRDYDLYYLTTGRVNLSIVPPDGECLQPPFSRRRLHVAKRI